MEFQKKLKRRSEDINPEMERKRNLKSKKLSTANKPQKFFNIFEKNG